MGMGLILIFAATMGISMIASAFVPDGISLPPDSPDDDDAPMFTDGPDLFQGSDDDEQADGGAGDDTLLGGNGADTLIGGLENDLIDGGAGDDRIFAGDGDDFAAMDPGNDGVFLGAGNDYAAPLDPTAIDTGADMVRGGDGNDTLIGDGGHDTLMGDAGDDVLDLTGQATGSAEGGAGDDHLLLDDGDIGYGGNGSDTFETWVTPGQEDAAIVIRDFDTARDELAVAIRNAPPGYVPDVTFTDTGSGLEALLDGQRFALLNGLGPADISAIRLRLV